MSSIFKLNLAKIHKLRKKMGREKNKRKLNFKPIVKNFIPENGNFQGITNILHEEIEAIYLMDVLELYQEDAAKRMEISRPTFTRIIKNARKKIANALISGYKINIQDDKDDFKVAICTNDKLNLNNTILTNNYIIIYGVKNKNIISTDIIENPIIKNNEKPAIFLPSFFVKNNVNFFISSKIGDGLKHSLLAKGIQSFVKEKVDLKDICFICS